MIIKTQYRWPALALAFLGNLIATLLVFSQTGMSGLFPVVIVKVLIAINLVAFAYFGWRGKWPLALALLAGAIAAWLLLLGIGWYLLMSANDRIG